MNFFCLTRRKDLPPTTVSSEESSSGLSMHDVLQVINHFPVGLRLQYFPEYDKDRKLDTIIAGYMINNYVLYTNKEIRCVDKENTGPGIEMQHDKDFIRLERVHDFQILIPYLARRDVGASTEKRKAGGPLAMEAQADDFLRGSSITLFYHKPAIKGFPQIDTEVEKRVVFKSGPHAGRELVILRPLLESFECIDLRRFTRINTCIPVQILMEGKKTLEKEMAGNCFIHDFSDKFVRIQIVEEKAHLLMTLAEKDSIALKIFFPDKDLDMVLKGLILRKRKNNLIIALQGMLTEEAGFQTIEALDEIYIKSLLLDHQSTQNPPNAEE